MAGEFVKKLSMVGDFNGANEIACRMLDSLGKKKFLNGLKRKHNFHGKTFFCRKFKQNRNLDFG